MPEISVIMGVYNGAVHLRQTVQSVLSQTFADFELIIVDDGSTDATPALLGELAKGDSRVKVFTNPQNVGLTKTLNIALSKVAGRYVARQDCGDISAPDRLRTQYDYLAANTGIVLCGTGISLIDESGKVVKSEPVVSGPEKISKVIESRNVFAHGSVMFRTEIVRQAGGYNEAYAYAQDYELFLRLAPKYRMDNLKDSLYSYRLSAGSISLTKAYEQAVCAGKARHQFNCGSEPVGEALVKIQKDSRVSSANDAARFYMLNGRRGLAVKGFMNAFLLSWNPVYLYRSAKSLIC